MLRSPALPSRLGSAAAPPRPAPGRCALSVRADRKSTKRVKVVLLSAVSGLGVRGDLEAVRNGFFRNYLLPNGLAKLVDASVLAAIKAKEVADEAAARKLVDEATALATALTTISKFTVRMKTGEAEGRERRIFGAVLPEMVVDAIAQQTSVKLDKAMLTMPEEIKTTGSYPVTVRLHPQVNAAITLLVAKL